MRRQNAIVVPLHRTVCAIKAEVVISLPSVNSPVWLINVPVLANRAHVNTLLCFNFLATRWVLVSAVAGATSKFRNLILEVLFRILATVCLILTLNPVEVNIKYLRVRIHSILRHLYFFLRSLAQVNPLEQAD